MIEPINDDIVVQQGTDFTWARALLHDDGTIKNLTMGTNEVQTVTITGGPTGGTFNLTYNGATTAAIAWNATALAVQSALAALTTIGSGNVSCGGGPFPGTAVPVTFIGTLGRRDVVMTTATSSLTGGTSPAVAIAETVKGVVGWTGRFMVYPNSDYDAVPVVTLTTANGGLELGVLGIQRASTTLSAAAAAGANQVTVTSASSFVVGDTITVVIDEVAVHEATIAEISGTTITLSAALGDAVASGAVVQTWDPDYMLANVLLNLDDAATAALLPWGLGVFDLDLIDPFGHSARYWHGTACLQEGSS